MPSGVPPIARIRLARAPFRLLIAPALLLLAGGAMAAFAVLGPPVAGKPVWLALVGAGAVLAMVGLGTTVRLFTLRLDVEEAAVRTRWLGGERLHPLVPGPVTRVRLRGPNASSLRSRTGWLGWTIGGATLRGEERIEVVRLAPTASAILVPTEQGRLAIAAASESELIEALSRAARARQRLEQLPRPEPIRDGVRDAAFPDAAEPEGEAAPEPHVLTGIERALLEEREALERERLAADATDGAAATAVPGGEGMTAQSRTGDASEAAQRDARPTAVAGARARLGRPRPSIAFLFLPLVGAGGVWLLAGLAGRLPEAGSDLGRLTSLGLVLAGPATSVGAIMARAWWPRLVGVVVTSGLATAVFVARSLLGP